MVPFFRDRRTCGRFAEFEEFRTLRGDIVDPRGGLDEFLPDHDSVFVAEVVEILFFDNPAAPDADEVDVRFHRHFDSYSSMDCSRMRI